MKIGDAGFDCRAIHAKDHEPMWRIAHRTNAPDVGVWRLSRVILPTSDDGIAQSYQLHEKMGVIKWQKITRH
ncbi:hypothetical protein AB4851_06130 [Burkholderia sp. 22PA0099]|uniref:hypothetical protein n=1 Tax=Burkholderia sp. 22PA0099 TaxID=3237372 RepID=UPI0039C0DF7D